MEQIDKPDWYRYQFEAFPDRRRRRSSRLKQETQEEKSMKPRNLCAGFTALAAIVASMGAGPALAQDKKPYLIYLSNNFVGNDWRQQMERVATVAVGKAPLAGRVDLKIENAEGTV